MIINPYIYGVATSYDPDAQLFFNAESGAGVTLTTTQMNAVNQWVVDAKSAGIWTKMKAVYPIVGGTATAHKFNLKNPADTNAAFRLAFQGGGTHSANGYLPNGTNAWADTFLTPSTTLTLNSQHISFYSRTNSNGTEVEIGCNNNGNSPNTLLEIRTAGTTYASLSASGYTTYVDANSLGLYIGNRTASNVTNLFKNNTKVATTAIGSTTSPFYSIGIGALNSGTLRQYYTTKECAFASIGDGLSDLESQLFYQITEKYQVTLGRNINTTQSFYYNSAYNNETNAFLFSTQITDTTTQVATNTLVSDLKTANIFTKMKAVYPMVGGTATTCKFNLVNPQDSNAAYRLVFSGGGTFSSNGYLPNGTNAYADTFLNANVLTQNSTHISYYSRTNRTTNSNSCMGSWWVGGLTIIYARYLNSLYTTVNNSGADYAIQSVTDSLGLLTASRTASNLQKGYKNIASVSNGGVSMASGANSYKIGATVQSNGTTWNYDNLECAFASIGDGLTDLESQLFYQITEKYQVALGRNVNPTQTFYYNTAYNNETNAFLFSTQITDTTIQTATNTLVTDLKTAGVFTKMKAIYPMVGGTATTHKYNLINPQDTDAAFRLSFVGGWTHSANGALPNGTNAYADTKLIPSTSLTSNNHHLSFYSRTNNTTTSYDLACQSIQASSSQYGYMTLGAYNSGTSYYQQQTQNTNAITPVESNTLGFYNGTRTSSTSFKGIKNGVVRGTNTALASTIGSYLAMNSLYLGAFNLNNNGTISTIAYSNRECAFSSIGNGLTDAEALAFYNAVQLFNTTLARQV